MTQDARPASGPPQLSRYRYFIAGMVLSAHFALGLNLFSIAPIISEVIRDYGINSSAASLLMSLPLLVAAVFGLPGGIIVGRLGHVRSFGIGWFLIALVTASAIAPDFLSLLALRLFYGLSFAFVITVTGPILIHWFSSKEVLVMNGLNTAILSLGIAVSVPTSALLANEVGWQNAMGAFGAIGVLGAVAWVWFGRGAGAAVPHSALVPVEEILKVIRSRPIVLLLAADAGVLVQYTALTAWLPTFYAEARGMTPTQAGFVTGLLPFVGIFAVLLGGFLPLRIGTPKVYFIIPGLMIAVGGPGAFLLGDPAGIYVSLVLVSIGSWLYVPTLLSRSMELVGMVPSYVAIVWGSFMTFSGFGMFISPIIVGAARDVSGSFMPGFAICAIASLTLLLAGIAMTKSPAPSRA